MPLSHCRRVEKHQHTIETLHRVSDEYTCTSTMAPYTCRNKLAGVETAQYGHIQCTSTIGSWSALTTSHNRVAGTCMRWDLCSLTPSLSPFKWHTNQVNTMGHPLHCYGVCDCVMDPLQAVLCSPKPMRIAINFTKVMATNDVMFNPKMTMNISAVRTLPLTESHYLLSELILLPQRWQHTPEALTFHQAETM